MTAPTPSPAVLDLLTRPRDFFTALKNTPPSSARFVWLVLLSGLVGGLYAALSQRAVQQAMADIPGLPGGGLGMIIAVIGALFISFIMWLIMWGLGQLGSGSEGRPAEVYGASFLIPLVISLLLLPITALFPLHVNVPAPNFSGLEGAELSRAIQQYSRAIQADLGKQPLSIVGNVLTYAGMAWQFYLAWLGFSVLTGDRQKALRGTLIPLVVFLLLGGAFWLLGRAVGGMA